MTETMKAASIKIKKWLTSFSSKVRIVEELMKFLWQRKLWWLIPFILFLILLGVLIIFIQQSAVAPFIYTLF